MSIAKTNKGRFFEDYKVGDVLTHAVPRTVGQGERALYHALYPARHALYSSDTFAQACGLPAAPLDDMIAFHTVFGKTVPDVSLNAVANLGYAEGRTQTNPVLPFEFCLTPITCDCDVSVSPAQTGASQRPSA